MGIEIERKFLVRGDSWRVAASRGAAIRQGYLVTEEDRSVRVRLRDGTGTLTIKGRSTGAARPEFEYGIPADEAAELLDTLVPPPLLEKRRYHVAWEGSVFEVDVFEGDNEGLVVAEIELPSEDAKFKQPDWLGPEVTDDPRYYNANLVKHPFSEWGEREEE